MPALLQVVLRREHTPRRGPDAQDREVIPRNQLSRDQHEPQEEVVNRLSSGAIVESLAAVPPVFREAVVLVDVGEFSYAEAAEILNVPIGTVMSRLYRGRRLLKQALAERTNEEEMS